MRREDQPGTRSRTCCAMARSLCSSSRIRVRPRSRPGPGSGPRRWRGRPARRFRMRRVEGVEPEHQRLDVTDHVLDVILQEGHWPQAAVRDACCWMGAGWAARRRAAFTRAVFCSPTCWVMESPPWREMRRDRGPGGRARAGGGRVEGLVVPTRAVGCRPGNGRLPAPGSGIQPHHSPGLRRCPVPWPEEEARPRSLSPPPFRHRARRRIAAGSAARRSGSPRHRLAEHVHAREIPAPPGRGRQPGAGPGPAVSTTPA